MKLTGYRITEQAYLEEVLSELAIEQWKRNEGIYCLDVKETDPGELEAWLNKLGVSELAIDCCMQSIKVSAVFPLENEVFFQLPVYTSQSGTEPFDIYLSCLCLENMLIILNTNPITDIDHFVHALKSQLALANVSISALLSIMLARESFLTIQMVEELRASVFKLDERMDRDPDTVDADEIQEQKRTLQVYDTVANGQSLCFEQLRVLDTKFLSFVEISTYFQLATANASAASQGVSRIEKTISDLSQRFDSNQQEKTNHRLAVLTILSAIFMPITLIAGIYGMNFENMPELHISWGYPVIIIVMLLIAAGMYRYFKDGGWLD